MKRAKILFLFGFFAMVSLLPISEANGLINLKPIYDLLLPNSEDIKENNIHLEPIYQLLLLHSNNSPPKLR